MTCWSLGRGPARAEGNILSALGRVAGAAGGWSGSPCEPSEETRPMGEGRIERASHFIAATL
jgi:hypothetical protein